MSTIYVQFKKRVTLKQNSTVHLGDIVNLTIDDSTNSKLMELVIFEQSLIQENEFVIDGLFLIQKIKSVHPNMNVHFVGETYTVAHVEKSGQPMVKIFVPLIWLLLFIGTAMTIMNFHHDVGMQDVQQKLHYIFTGKENKRPLWLQVPYSLGLGVGMILFFNYWFTKRFNKEPSPLEVELFKYEEELEQYKHHKALKNDDTSN